MILNNLIVNSINKYGVSCSLKLEDSSYIPFKAVIYHSSPVSFKNSDDFLTSNPFAPSFSTLITADPKILKVISPNLTVKTADISYQILQCNKFLLSDKLIYISASLSPI